MLPCTRRILTISIVFAVAFLATDLFVFETPLREYVVGISHVRQAEADVDDCNYSSPLLSVQPVENAADLMPFSSFSPWIQEYISFHRSFIKEGKLEQNAQYLIYQCKDGDIRCGGAGDRMIAMVKTFYLAMCTRRVFLMDSTFPIPLTDVLKPGHIQWNATYPVTNETYNDLDYDAPFDLRPNIRGYRIPRTNGWPRKKSFHQVWNEFVVAKLLDEDENRGRWRSQATNTSLADAIHEAFWAMFTFDSRVVERAEQLKASAGINPPYIGLHMRTGDDSMGIATRTKMKRATDSLTLQTCYNFIRSEFPCLFAAYLASDDVRAKEIMRKGDSSIHYASGFRPFHVDLLARNHNSINATYNASDTSVFQGVVDTWAEILVLAQSSFLVVSRSMFSFASYYIRSPRACAVYLDTCSFRATGNGSITYYGEFAVGDVSLITSARCLR
ncbi:hypothetical protein ACHAW6_013058 [Cyclotella cf. meneghiniana]